MGKDFFTSIVSIGTAIVGVAIISVLVSKNAQTPAVISSAGTAFGQDLAVAVSPVTGNSNLGSSLSVNGLDTQYN